MKQIALTRQNKSTLYALVDDEDYEFLNKYDWRYAKGKNTYYAVVYLDLKPVFMHQLVCPCPQGTTPDHINRNGLDNQKHNLRPANVFQQGSNTKLYKSNKSGYRGVSFRPDLTHEWRATIKVKGKVIHLGDFYTKREAALKYNHAAIKYFGEFAQLNNVLPEVTV